MLVLFPDASLKQTLTPNYCLTNTLRGSNIKLNSIN